jgi:acetyl-CoA synthetase
MSEILYPVLEQAKQNSFLDVEKYQTMYQQSIESPNEFWQQQSAIVDWSRC